MRIGRILASFLLLALFIQPVLALPITVIDPTKRAFTYDPLNRLTEVSSVRAEPVEAFNLWGLSYGGGIGGLLARIGLTQPPQLLLTVGRGYHHREEFPNLFFEA